jgi:subtilisin family serine protease
MLPNGRPHDDDLLAPGEQITSLGSEGQLVTLGGTSAAAPFVTSTIGFGLVAVSLR